MSLIELACRSAECAPPPVGTGGSSPTVDSLDDLPEGFVTDAEEAAKRVFNFEFTDREGRKFVAKIDDVEESDAGVVTVEGTIFSPGPRVSGRRRPTAVGYFTRQVDGWRMHHDSLSIMPDHQGKGIGSAFIAESMRRAADEGVTLVDTQATSSKSSNGVYTWLRAGFDTPTGMVSAGPTRKNIGRRFSYAGDTELAARLYAGPVPTKDLLTSPVAREALGQAPKQMITMSLQKDISDLKTEAALAASAFTDWIERAITFTLSEDETWYEPLVEGDLTAAGCQDASCAPPPVGTGGSKSVSVYHLTDDPKFAPRADFVPEDNTLAIRERTSPGLYVAKDSWDIEKWVNGSGYLRPYVAEITVPEDAMADERWGGEGFIPGDRLGQATVKRVIPIDAFAREVYGDYGWVEDTLGTKFDTGEPVPTDNSVRYAEGGRPVGYIYDGPDVRDMPEAETKRLARDAEKALGIRTGTAASADPFAGLEVYGFACRSAACAPPPVGTGGSSPGSDLPGIVDWISGKTAGEIPVFDPDSDAGKLILDLANEFHADNYGDSSEYFDLQDLRSDPIEVWRHFITYEQSRMWLSATVREGANPAEQVLLGAIHENWMRRSHGETVPIYRSVDGETAFGDPYAPNAGWKADSVAPDQPGTGLVSAFWGRGRGVPDGTPWGHDLATTDGRVDSPYATRAWYGDVQTTDVLGVFGDMSDGIGGEIIVGRPGLVERLLRGEPSDQAQARLSTWSDFSAEFACHDASCAPPPVGTGGSKPGADDGIPGIADQEAYDQYRSTTNNIRLLDVESAAYAQQQVQDAEVIVRISADRLSDIINYSEPEDWELRSMHDPENEVGRSLRGEEYLQHRDLYDAAVGLDMGYVVHGYSEAEFSVEPIQAADDPNPFEISHRVSPQAATWYGEIQLVMADEARDDATFTIADSLNSGSVPLPVEGPIDPRAAALNGVHPFQMGRDYVEVQLRAPIELSSKHVKEIRVPDLYYLQDVAHVLAERMPDTMVVIEDDGMMMTMKNAVTALEEIS